MSVQIIRASEELRGLGPEWADLFEKCPAAPPFLHPAWQLSWWDVFGSAELHTIGIRTDGRLTALAPCYRYDNRLVFIGNGISDQLDILAEDSSAAAELLNALARYRLDLQEIPEGSQLLGFPHEHCSVCPTVDLSGETPKNMRKTLRVGLKYLESRGKVERQFSTSPAFLDDLFRLHRARWQTRGEEGVLAAEQTELFHRLAASELAAAGLLRMHALLVNSQVIGVVYAFARNGTVYSYLGGFDPEWQDGSPGALSIGDAMEYARRQGDRYFDFLRGAERYKYLWGAVDRVQYRTST